MFCNGQVNHLTWIQLSSISFTEDETEGKLPKEQAGTEDSHSRGLAERHQVPDFRLSMTAKDLQPNIQNDNLIYDYVALSNYFWSFKLMKLCQATTATVFSSCLFFGQFPFSFVFGKWNISIRINLLIKEVVPWWWPLACEGFLTSQRSNNQEKHDFIFQIKGCDDSVFCQSLHSNACQ